MIGTRPEAIKMAPLIEEFQSHSNINSVVCSTGQHTEMINQVVNEFKLKIDHFLDLERIDFSLPELYSKLITNINIVLLKERPDWVFVHGDTATAFCSSLSAYFLKIPVVHVEAGLRTDNIYSPWPEEINRQLISKIAVLHFAPTEFAKNNLTREGIDCNNIIVTGNTVIDALLQTVNNIKNQNSNLFQNQLNGINSTKKLLLVTGHRRENFGRGIESVCEALLEIASKHDDVEIIYPVHPNPNIQEPVNRILGGKDRIHLIQPLEYRNFVHLMSICFIILTDSGGIQEEAPSLNKPVLVMRDETERVEALKAGTVKLVGTNRSKIINEVDRLLNDELYYSSFSNSTNPYGDGNSSIAIYSFFVDYLKTTK